jgi:Cysteine-rich secretory protein family
MVTGSLICFNDGWQSLWKRGEAMMMRRPHRFLAAALGCLCFAGPLAAQDDPAVDPDDQSAATQPADQPDETSASSPAPSVSDQDLSAAMLQVHNRERAAVGVPPLSWSPDLAAHAGVWAAHLGTLGTLEHAQGAGEGENLWMGSSGGFTPDQMAQGWVDEKKTFQNGAFPNVSTTGSWMAVGHYTQMIWRGTTQVGCAIGHGAANDVLVCRYSPPGNVTTQNVF